MTEERIRVLIIEDDLMVQEVNRQFIQNVQGYSVVGVASNGEEGIRLVREHRPELVILDVFMPEKDGVETLKHLRAENEQVDVIVITAARDRETIQLMLRYGAVDYILKPFKFDRFQKSLDNYRLMRSHWSLEGGVSQAELDQIIRLKAEEWEGTKDQGREQLPKGLHAVTLKQVVMLLLEQRDSLSAEDVAEKVGIARVTARRYLEYLEKEGEVSKDIRYGGVGRPMNRYVYVRK